MPPAPRKVSSPDEAERPAPQSTSTRLDDLRTAWKSETEVLAQDRLKGRCCCPEDWWMDVDEDIFFWSLIKRETEGVWRGIGSWVFRCMLVGSCLIYFYFSDARDRAFLLSTPRLLCFYAYVLPRRAI